MPFFADLDLPHSIASILQILVADKEISGRDQEVCITRGRLRMELSHCNEGWNGDYDDTDPQDSPLLRFSFYGVNEDEAGNDRFDELDDCSYCTSIDARLPWEVRLACACAIFDEVAAKLWFDEKLGIDPPGVGGHGPHQRLDQGLAVIPRIPGQVVTGLRKWRA